MNQSIKQKIGVWICYWIGITILLSNSLANSDWITIDSPTAEMIIQQSLIAQKTSLNTELMQESNRLITESRIQNKQWDDQYFNLVSHLQDTYTESQRYTALTTRITQLEQLIQQHKINMVSVKEIYKNRLKAIPTAYLLLSRIRADIETRARKDIDLKLANLAKQFLSDSFTPVFLTSATMVKDLKVIQDIVQFTQAGRVESFESDPVRQMTEDGQFFLLQKYRIYPDFYVDKNSPPMKKDTAIFTPPEHFHAEIIYSLDYPQQIPTEFKVGDNYQKLKMMLSEMKAYNSLQLQQVNEINSDYEMVIEHIIEKMNSAESELTQVKDSLSKDFQGKTKHILKQNIISAEQKLNEHVRERQMILVTVQSELSQRGEHLNDLYAKMITLAYEDLLDRAKQLKTYKFFTVENHVLVHCEAQTYYSDPIPTAFTIPLKRKTYIEDEGGVYRCGILLGLKVKFTLKPPEKSGNRKNSVSTDYFDYKVLLKPEETEILPSSTTRMTYINYFFWGLCISILLFSVAWIIKLWLTKNKSTPNTLKNIIQGIQVEIDAGRIDLAQNMLNAAYSSEGLTGRKYRRLKKQIQKNKN
ncbi:MAG: hypothetical protein HQK77_03075 [Desulfobacterales bacterium]|nr:hypothetical protein [Desulfobacterales bacterium]